MSGPLAGQVVSVIGPGSPLQRAIAVTCAESGADIALGTIDPRHEFEVASIANEVWAIGRKQFVEVMDATEPTAAASFADETGDTLVRCDALVWVPPTPAAAPLDELSHEEWEATLGSALTAPFLAAQAFGRVMERAGRGAIVFVAPDPVDNAAAETVRAALEGLTSAINEAWGPRGVRAIVVSPAPIAAATAQGIVAHLAATPG